MWTKGLDDSGVQDFRLIHDGTHYVWANPSVKQLDLVEVTQAKDVRRVTSWQAATGMQHSGLTADVSDAHRIPRVVEQD